MFTTPRVSVEHKDTKQQSFPSDIKAALLANGQLASDEKIAQIKEKLKDKAGSISKEELDSPYDVYYRPATSDSEEIFAFVFQYLDKGSYGSTYLLHNINNPQQALVLKTQRCIKDDPRESKNAQAAKLAIARFFILDDEVDEESDHGKEIGTEEIVMEWVPGVSFAKFLDDPLKYEYKSQKITSLYDIDWFDFIDQLFEILINLHSLGVLHLDIKPENFKIDENGKLHILDFGSSVASEIKKTHVVNFTSELAGKHIKVAELASSRTPESTPGYAAPEIASADIDQRHAGQQTDIYSIGVLIAEMLNLTHPDQARLPDPRHKRLKGIMDPFENEIASFKKELLAAHDETKSADKDGEAVSILNEFVKALEDAIASFKADLKGIKPKSEYSILSTRIEVFEKAIVEIEKKFPASKSVFTQKIKEFLKKLEKASLLHKDFLLESAREISKHGVRILSEEEDKLKNHPKIKNRLVLQYIIKFLNEMLKKNYIYRPESAEICREYFAELRKLQRKPVMSSSLQSSIFSQAWKERESIHDAAPLEALLGRLSTRLDGKREKHELAATVQATISSLVMQQW